jgi:hypothetical protein
MQVEWVEAVAWMASTDMLLRIAAKRIGRVAILYEERRWRFEWSTVDNASQAALSPEQVPSLTDTNVTWWFSQVQYGYMLLVKRPIFFVQPMPKGKQYSFHLERNERNKVVERKGSV